MSDMTYQPPSASSAPRVQHVVGQGAVGAGVLLAQVAFGGAWTSAYPVVVRDPQRDRLILAETFASRVSGAPGVLEVWLVPADELRVVVVTDGLDLERELRLRTEFIELVRSTDERATATLSVYPDNEDWATRLWPSETRALTRIMPSANGR